MTEDGDSANTASIFYIPETKQCWLIKSEFGPKLRGRRLIDATTGIEAMLCVDFPVATPDGATPGPKQSCDYINDVENGHLVMGFMPAHPHQDSAPEEKTESPKR